MKYERTPRGTINNCALANGDSEENCQVCGGQCPDRAVFAVDVAIRNANLSPKMVACDRTKKRKQKCDFCLKPLLEVKFMVAAATGACICDECIVLAIAIMAKEIANGG